MQISRELFELVSAKLRKIAQVLVPIMYGMGFGLTARLLTLAAIGVGLLIQALRSGVPVA